MAEEKLAEAAQMNPKCQFLRFEEILRNKSLPEDQLIQLTQLIDKVLAFENKVDTQGLAEQIDSKGIENIPSVKKTELAGETNISA